MTRLVHAFLFLAVAAVVHGANIIYDFALADGEIAPDGFTRDAQLVNGLFPGTLITASKGDSVVVNVHNNLLDASMCRSTSIVCAIAILPLHGLIDNL